MEQKKDWVKDLIVYQVYPRSFQDSNGDGIGDIPGILSRLDHLSALGINALWLSPVFRSPNDDNGYDISGYREIMDEFGTMEDWDALCAECHKRGIKVIMDLVVNHSSDEHPWFLESKTSRDNPKSDYYIWRDPKNGKEPNNWASVFGGSAWEFVPERGQYYYHLFSKKQPDLNWANPALREEIFSMMEWWVKKGVDGFRVDAISYLDKPQDFPDSAEPPQPDGYSFSSSLINGRPGTHAYIRDMNRRVFSPYNVMTVGEVASKDAEELARYVNTDREEFDYFDTDALLVFSEGSKLKERMRTTLWQWGEDVRGLLAEGVLCRGLDMYTETYEYALKRAEDTASVYMDAFARGSYDTPTKALVNMTVRQLSVWGGSTQLLAEDLTAALHNRHACAVLAGTERAAMNVAADLKAAGLPAGYFESLSAITPGTVAVVAGTLSAGFEYPNAKFTLITHGRMSAGSQPKAKKKDKNSKAVYSLAELTPGDYVVHATHGIGIFEGIHKIDMQGITKDYIKLRYAKNDTLYVPVTQLDLVAKYIGPREDSGVKLHRLGGTEWQKSKARVRAAVKDIAKELIVLYAQRMKQKGFAFPEDNEWQHDFEAHFEYNETDDQLRCINEIKNDMEREAPMDRLLCGDVGFGKTEVALRAAFKCITAGKQCAILVPTTILAWQHYQTVLKRMEGFPVDVELLSRFRTPRQQDEILRKLRRGSIDLIVGTHRLVSKDVQFKDLGLVIIDEEQRFGVQQKERLKDVCKSADILTLSATPIPRTLNMALSGIRDMSVIEEAPHDRHPVQTYVMEYDPGVISDAIKKELRRGGQVYYLHNDVASIERVAAGIRERVPEARIGIGHGKMSEQELSEVWRRLMEHEIDVLVCTTIIETGVDVPNANTLIIDNADRMGLSQLHQLRGRVGRSTRRAYAYFTFTRGKVLSEISQKRLAAIREFTEFGSGFKIAMRDLEIRGAGNILGGEQHGHMESVGYDMYLKLLNEAVAMMKGEAPENPVEECTVDMQVQAHIPESYIDSTALRLDVYRRIADIKTYEDSSDVVDELIDRFGEPPESVYGLIDIALLRNRATQLGITEVKQQANALLLYKDKFDMERVKRLIQGMPNKVMLSAGSRPYISVALGGKAPLTVLEDILKVLCGDEDAKAPKPATK